MNEKALIAVGDSWEVAANKKLLANVTEASLFHMKGVTITSKLGSYLCSGAFPSLRVLRLYNNDFHSIKHVSELNDFTFGVVVVGILQ